MTTANTLAQPQKHCRAEIYKRMWNSNSGKSLNCSKASLHLRHLKKEGIELEKQANLIFLKMCF